MLLDFGVKTKSAYSSKFIVGDTNCKKKKKKKLAKPNGNFTLTIYSFFQVTGSIQTNYTAAI